MQHSLASPGRNRNMVNLVLVYIPQRPGEPAPRLTSEFEYVEIPGREFRAGIYTLEKWHWGSISRPQEGEICISRKLRGRDMIGWKYYPPRYHCFRNSPVTSRAVPVACLHYVASVTTMALHSSLYLSRPICDTAYSPEIPSFLSMSYSMGTS